MLFDPSAPKTCLSIPTRFVPFASSNSPNPYPLLGTFEDIEAAKCGTCAGLTAQIGLAPLLRWKTPTDTYCVDGNVVKVKGGERRVAAGDGQRL